MEYRPKNAFALLTIALAVAVQSISASEAAVNNAAADQHHAADHHAASNNNGSVISAAPVTASSVPAVTAANVGAATNNASTNLIPVEVYYEALCSDSVKFVSSKLLPAYNNLSKFINVTFVPFAQGNISFNDDKSLKLTCKRELECNADKVHACGIHKITDSDKLIKFVNCALTEGLKSSNKTVPINECGKNSSIDSDVITAITVCANSTESDPWLQNYANMSSKALVKSVPKVIINQVVVTDEELTSSDGLMKAVCAKIPEKDLPVECKSINSGSETLIVGVLPIIIGAFYIMKMI